jgi:hypothetical protein
MPVEHVKVGTFEFGYDGRGFFGGREIKKII